VSGDEAGCPGAVDDELATLLDAADALVDTTAGALVGDDCDDDCGLVLPPTAPKVDDETVDFALALIEAAGVVETVEARLKSCADGELSVRALFVAFVIMAVEARPMLLSVATGVLFYRLGDRARATLGLTSAPAGRKGFLACYRKVRFLFHALTETMDPSTWPKNKVMALEELGQLRKETSAKDQLAARERLEGFVNDVIFSSFSALSRKERRALSRHLGLDATCLELFSRGEVRLTTDGDDDKKLSASDPDGGWYVRGGGGDYSEREGAGAGAKAKNGRKRAKLVKALWALEATIAVLAPRSAHKARTAPSLVAGAVLERPGVDPGGTGSRLLAHLVARGHGPGFSAADRAYSAALPERYHLPARALGFRPVMDYRVDELGIQANEAGAVLIEGTWCCPAMPEALVEATKDYRAGKIDEETYKERIAARAPFFLRRKEGPDRDGFERYCCPAAGEDPKVICPLRPASRTPLDGRPLVTRPPEDPPKVCRQGSVTISPDVGVRHRQDLPFGGEAWCDLYGTLRNAIEGLNGYAKDGGHEALGDPSRRRVRGIAAQSVFVAFVLLGVNLRRIRSWRAEARLDPAGNLVAPAHARRRRRRTSLADHAPATGQAKETEAAPSPTDENARAP
jgi:hypothetical protein